MSITALLLGVLTLLWCLARDFGYSLISIVIFF